jgi:CO/xanthine dehydrogenase Mo-binding subunit
MMIAEVYMDHLARVAGIPLVDLQTRNFYEEAAPTHFGQPLEGSQVRPPAQ